MLCPTKQRVAFQGGCHAAPKPIVRPSRVLAVRCAAQRQHSFAEGCLAAFTAGCLLLAPAPALAALPPGFKSPTLAADQELTYESIIEKRTGKSEALPELVALPEGKPNVKADLGGRKLISVEKIDQEARSEARPPAQAPVVVPVAPAVPAPPMPTLPPKPVVEEAAPVVIRAEPSAPKPVAPEPVAAPAPVAGFKAAPAPKPAGVAAPTPAPAVAAEPAGNNGLVIGGGVAVVALIAAAALANGNSSEQPSSAPPAVSAPPADAPAQAVDTPADNSSSSS